MFALAIDNRSSEGGRGGEKGEGRREGLRDRERGGGGRYRGREEEREGGREDEGAKKRRGGRETGGDRERERRQREGEEIERSWGDGEEMVHACVCAYSNATGSMQLAVEAMENIRTVASLSKEASFVRQYKHLTEKPFR